MVKNYSEKLRTAVQNLYTLLKDAEYGKSFSWIELKQMSGRELSLGEIYYVTRIVNTMLMMNDSRSIVTVHGVGKQILKPEQHRLEAKREIKKSVRIYRKGGMLLNSANLDLLDGDERKKVIEDAARVRSLEMFTTELLQTPKKLESANKQKNVRGIMYDTFKEMAKEIKEENSGGTKQ